MQDVRKHSTSRWAEWWQHQPYGDVALALVIGVFEIVATYFATQSEPEHGGFGLGALLLLLVSTGSLAFLRRYPAFVLIFVAAITLVYVLLGYPAGPNYLALIAAFFAAVVKNRRAIAWAVFAVCFVLFLWLPYLLGNTPAPTTTDSVGLAGWLLLLAAAAEIVRVQLQRAKQAALELEAEARRRADEERMRIARELHDVLGHHLSLISVQAGVALHLMDEKPEQAQVALSVIKDASKEALRELRSVLNVLRQVDESAPRFPSPGLANLDDLVSRAADAGLRVYTEVTGDLNALPASVDLAAFRIIQEAVTNVIRHSGQSTARVYVARNEHELVVRIENDLPKPFSRDGIRFGQGILGMKERAAALGGSVEASAGQDGFQVVARLPLDSHSSINVGMEHDPNFAGR